MAEHENCIGETSEWYTPPEIFQALHGIVLVGMGAVACEALRRCGLGMVWDRTRRVVVL